ncbi:MAG: hypothetical protein KC776_23365 [Myxococcales bacterium]|nr:hypothetical protein [Myxococcales bacterium]MCB9575472.1 hypothetical protein [Polyangiaceae bacterium]
MKRIALALWELPQNVLGLSLLGLERTLGTAVGTDSQGGRLMIESKLAAVSLGHFVFWCRARESRYFVLDDQTRAHEYGHTFQSRLLGPLYLPLVGVPSVMRVLYAIAHREVTGRRWTRYFDGYPENWADRLGGVTRGRPGGSAADRPPNEE